MKTILIAIAILNATAAYAMCTNYTVIGPDGRTLYCQKCCGPDGNCQVYCF